MMQTKKKYKCLSLHDEIIFYCFHLNTNISGITTTTSSLHNGDKIRERKIHAKTENCIFFR